MVYFHFQSKLIQIKLLGTAHIQISVVFFAFQFNRFKILWEKERKNLKIYEEILIISKPHFFIFFYVTSLKFLIQENKPFIKPSSLDQQFGCTKTQIIWNILVPKSVDCFRPWLLIFSSLPTELQQFYFYCGQG